MPSIAEKFGQLVSIIAKLRDPQGGCPWDLKQTHASLKPYMVEEAYEVLDAIDALSDVKGNLHLKEELGDVLLQVLLHSQIASDEETFTIADVLDCLTAKLIERHPHVFGDVEARDAEEVLQNWEKIKQAQKPAPQSVLDGVPRSLPSLLQAHRMGEKVARVGFDWENLEGIGDKVLEEVREFVAATRDDQNREHISEELGDLLFTLAQFARKLGLNSEDLLRQANLKFCKRFQELERRCGHKLDGLGLAKLQEIWNDIKSSTTSPTP